MLARHGRAAMRLPRVLPSEKVHHLATQAAGRHRALRDREGSPVRGKPQVGRALGGALRSTVRVPGRLPGRERPHRRAPRLRARASEKGQKVARDAPERGHAVHLPRHEAHDGRAAARDEQQDRGQGQRAAEVDAEESQGNKRDAEGEGGVSVVLHARGVPQKRQGDTGDDAHRRRHRIALPEMRRKPGQQGRPLRSGARAWCGKSSITGRPIPMNWTSLQTRFCPITPKLMFAQVKIEGGFENSGQIVNAGDQ